VHSWELDQPSLRIVQDVILQKLYKHRRVHYIIYKSLLRVRMHEMLYYRSCVVYKDSIRTFNILFTEAFLLRGAHAPDIILQKLYKESIRIFNIMFTEAY